MKGYIVSSISLLALGAVAASEIILPNWSDCVKGCLGEPFLGGPPKYTNAWLDKYCEEIDSANDFEADKWAENVDRCIRAGNSKCAVLGYETKQELDGEVSEFRGRLDTVYCGTYNQLKASLGVSTSTAVVTSTSTPTSTSVPGAETTTDSSATTTTTQPGTESGTTTSAATSGVSQSSTPLPNDAAGAQKVGLVALVAASGFTMAALL